MVRGLFIFYNSTAQVRGLCYIYLFILQKKKRKKKKNVAVAYGALCFTGSQVICLTVEGQIAKQGSQKVHDVHDEDGEVGYMLHFLFRWAEIRRAAFFHYFACDHLKKQSSLTCSCLSLLENSVFMGQNKSYKIRNLNKKKRK